MIFLAKFPKDFRKTSYPDKDKWTNEVSEVRQTNKHMNKAYPIIDHPGGQLKPST